MDGSELTERDLRFIAHIIKDVFNPESGVIIYGADLNLIEVLRSPEFGIEAWGLHSDEDLEEQPNAFYWAAAHNASHFGPDFCNLFISIGYDKEFPIGQSGNVATRIHELMADSGILMVVDPGEWAEKLLSKFQRVSEIEESLARYTMFMENEVVVCKK